MQELFFQLMNQRCKFAVTGLVLDALEILIETEGTPEFEVQHLTMSVAIRDNEGELVNRWFELRKTSKRHARYRALPEIEKHVDRLLMDAAQVDVPASPVEEVPELETLPVEPAPTSQAETPAVTLQPKPQRKRFG